MTARDLLTAGDLDGALTQVTSDVRNRPTDYQSRTFLFELLCFTGDLDRASKQLAVLADADAQTSAAVERYQSVLDAERTRRDVVAGKTQPFRPGGSCEWLTGRLEALTHLASGQFAQARQTLEAAIEMEPAIAVSVNGNAVDNFRDADDRFGPVLEFFFGREYCWIPLSSLKYLAISQPDQLRDLIYLPARMELTTGILGEVYLPALYPGTHVQSDLRIRLGRMTDWISNAESELSIGAGQRLFVSGTGEEHQDTEREWPILEIRSLEVTPGSSLS